MFSADCWAPKFESEVPDWKKYQYIPSDFDEVICCLAMNMEPEVGLHLLSQQDSIENEKQYKHYVVYGDHQPDGSVDTDKDSFRIKELAFCIESANQLGFLDLPAQSLDLGDNFKVMEYMDGYIGEFIGEFKGAFYREYLEKGSLGGLPPVTEELKDGLHYLACSMNDKAAPIAGSSWEAAFCVT